MNWLKLENVVASSLKDRIENQSLEPFHPFKDPVVCYQPSDLGMYCCPGLQSIGSSKAVVSSDSSGQIGNF